MIPSDWGYILWNLGLFWAQVVFVAMFFGWITPKLVTECIEAFRKKDVKRQRYSCMQLFLFAFLFICWASSVRGA